MRLSLVLFTQHRVHCCSFTIYILLLFCPGSLAQNQAEILIRAGDFIMGDIKGVLDERPVRKIMARDFLLDKSPVSVAKFAEFIAATGYATTAEKVGDSIVFHMQTGIWSLVKGANWRQPFGPNGAAAPLDHPVTQVSWFDAQAYCQHYKQRLPSEAEFEFAAKGKQTATYAFGDKLAVDGDFLVNIYTGRFPFENTSEDGYLYTAPVGKTGITRIGLTDMAGNVWEWSADWYLPYGIDPDQHQPTERAQRGGSFLCADNYCRGYRSSARSHSTPDTSSLHVGFRCARDVREKDDR